MYRILISLISLYFHVVDLLVFSYPPHQPAATVAAAACLIPTRKRGGGGQGRGGDCPRAPPGGGGNAKIWSKIGKLHQKCQKLTCKNPRFCPKSRLEFKWLWSPGRPAGFMVRFFYSLIWPAGFLRSFKNQGLETLRGKSGNNCLCRLCTGLFKKTL